MTNQRISMKKDIEKLKQLAVAAGFKPVVFLSKEEADSFDFGALDSRTMVFIDDLKDDEVDE